MIKSFKLVNWTWRYALFVRIGGTRDQAEGWFAKKFGGAPASANGSGVYATMFYKLGERSHLIWFSETPPASICAHEAFHSAIHALGTSGMGKPDDTNDEAYAYLIQWTVENIMARAWK